MRRLALLLAPGVVAVFLVSWALAQDADKRRSGYQDMGPSLRAMQDDDTANPGMLWVSEGRALWAKREGAANKACADCHAGDSAMAGVAARYPAFDAATSRPIDLGQRVNRCRVEQQKAGPLAAESRELLALTGFIAQQSRGQPIAPSDDPRLRPFVAAGEALWRQRQGQLNLSCAQCHDDNAGGRLAGATIPQAHPTGYPIYRLEWQALGSLKRRLRNCLVGMRAEAYAYDSAEYLALELYLMSRARGMKVEAPGVRP
jgi:sulfur-oxidizing protein SoxA